MDQAWSGPVGLGSGNRVADARFLRLLSLKDSPSSL